MLEINYQNIEDIIFYNNSLHPLLPHFSHIFEQWKLGKQLNLNSQVTQAIANFIDTVMPPDVQVLEKALNDTIIVHRLNARAVKHLDTTLDIQDLSEFQTFNLCLYRKGNHLNITGWR